MTCSLTAFSCGIFGRCATFATIGCGLICFTAFIGRLSFTFHAFFHLFFEFIGNFICLFFTFFVSISFFVVFFCGWGIWVKIVINNLIGAFFGRFTRFFARHFGGFARNGRVITWFATTFTCSSLSTSFEGGIIIVYLSFH